MGSDGRPARASRSPEISTLAASAITQSSLHRTRSGNIRRLELRGRTSADEIDKCALLGPRKSGRRAHTANPSTVGFDIGGVVLAVCTSAPWRSGSRRSVPTTRTLARLSTIWPSCRHRSGPLDSITSMALRTHGLALMSRRRISRKGFLGELHNSRQADRERRAFARLAIDLSRPTSFDRTAC